LFGVENIEVVLLAIENVAPFPHERFDLTLNLSVVNGELSIQSEPGRGTTVLLAYPAPTKTIPWSSQDKTCLALGRPILMPTHTTNCRNHAIALQTPAGGFDRK